MSAEILSEDQIEALVARAKEGDLTAKKASRPAKRQRRVREIDFSRPSKFTSEQQKRIERAHETFCRAATTQLSAELRAQAELEVINVAQHVWSSAVAEVPKPSVFAVLEARPLGTRILLSIELSAMLRMIVRLLGGVEDGRIALRELTEIELTLTRRIFDSLIGQLSIIWHDLLGVDLVLLELDSAPQSVQLVPPSDPSLTVTMECRLADTSSTISLIVPHRAIASQIHELSSGHYGDTEAPEPDRAAAADVRASLSEVDVEVRVEVAATEMPIADVVALRPGDVVRFGVPAASGVMLYAENVGIHRARPGRSEHSRAVSVLEQLEVAR
jgi:flagellar motor switch protein FliM